MTLEKQTSYHHSVTELGNIQVRQVTEYVKDGEVIDKKYGDPMTPADTKDMTGWDDRSKEIIEAITDPKVRTEKVLEGIRLLKAALDGLSGDPLGVTETVSYDRVIELDGRIAVRQITRIFDGNIEVSKKYHRSWIMPGDDPIGADVMSKAIALKLHTSKCIKAYKDKMAEATMEI